MDKLKYIKIEDENGDLSDNIPIGADAENVDLSSSNNNTQTLADYISTNDKKINSVNLQISKLQDKDISLSDQIKSLSSGSPKGNYTTVNELKTANPDTGIYVITENGHIYSWSKDGSEAIDLGVYQATAIEDKSITFSKLNGEVKSILPSDFTLLNHKKLNDDGDLVDDNIVATLSDFFEIKSLSEFYGFANEQKSTTRPIWVAMRFFDENKRCIGRFIGGGIGSIHIVGEGSFESLNGGLFKDIKYVKIMIQPYGSKTPLTDEEIHDIMNNFYFIVRELLPVEQINIVKYYKLFSNINDENYHTFNRNILDDKNIYDLSKEINYKKYGYSEIYPEWHRFTILNDGNWTRTQYQNITTLFFFNREKIIVSGLKPDFRIKELYYDQNGKFLQPGDSWITGNNEDITFIFTNKGRLSIASFIDDEENDNRINIEDMLDGVVIKSYPLEADEIETDESKNIIKQYNNYMHISFDDVSICIQHLIDEQDRYETLFEEPFFKMLKDLHKEYGACFSLYIYNTSILSQLTDKFSNDFIKNNNWLKIGFHSLTTNGHLDQYTPEEALEQYNNFITNIYRITGGLNSVDRIPRLNYFQADTDDLISLRDTNCGIIGTLTADDSRTMNYLTETQRQYLRTHSKLIDISTGLTYLSTTLRLDWFLSNFSSKYEYYKPVKTNPYDELVYRYSKSENADYYSTIIVFTHEWQMYNNTNYIVNDNFINYLKQTCQFAKDYNYDFDFPQNRIQDMTSLASMI